MYVDAGDANQFTACIIIQSIQITLNFDSKV